MGTPGIFFAPILLLAGQMCLSQVMNRGVVDGKVIDRESRLAIVGANVTVSGTVLGTVTNKEGRFTVSGIPPGSRQILISMIGYKKRIVSISIPESGESGINVELDQMAIETEPVIITANRREQSLEEVPVSVSVVTNQMLKNRHTVTLDDALQHVPGVNITRSQINIRGSTGYSYGVGSRVLLLVDGIPHLTGDTEDIIWESISPAQIDRVEVVKGAGSALYGSSALGGVINIITSSFTHEPVTNIRMYGGMYSSPTYDSWRWTDKNRMSGGISFMHGNRTGKLGFNVGGSRTINDGYKKNDFVKRWNGWARVGYEFSPYKSLQVNFSILEQHRGNFLYWRDLDHALESKPEQTDDNVRSVRWSLGGSYKQFITNDFYFTVKTNFFRSRWEDNTTAAGDFSETGSTSDFGVADLQVNYQPTDRHHITGGVLSTVNGVSSRNMFGTRSAFGGAVYAQDEFNIFEGFHLSFGGRFDFQKLENLPGVNQFNPKVGFTYAVFRGTTFRASAGRGFRAPSAAEVFTNTEAAGLVIRPNPNLRPERSWSVEGGIRQSFAEFLHADLAVFHNELWDLIEPAFGDDGFVHFFNITRARTTGMEAVISANILDRIWLSQIGYTYLFPKDAETGEILKYRPRHLLYISSRINIEFVQLGIDFRYMSKIENIDWELVDLGIIPDGDVRVPVYVTDLHIAADWSSFGLPVTSAVHVENIFQYYYTDFLANLAPLRHIILSVDLKL
jgi:iron complex outermembrane receptor protein